jgi:N-acetylneuraminate synthase
MTANSLTIGSRKVGPGQSVYLVAELSANHNQDFDQAVQLIRAARDAGADAVKLQTYTADTLTIRSDRPEFQIRGGTLWDGWNLHDLYQQAYTPWEWQPKLKEVANGLGLDLFSTAFDGSAVAFLEEMGVPVHKVASFELVDIPLIQALARTGKPLILSTGMATLSEITEAVDAARHAGATEIALLKCTSAYPAPPAGMNLRTIPYLATTFNLPVGLSDHTLGIAVPVASVALGACLIEKHFTLSRKIPGPDSAFSLEPPEFKAMADAVRTAEQALGEVCFGSTGSGDESSRQFRRSLYTVKPIRVGEVFSSENVRSIRPAQGLSPKFLPEVLGKPATRDIPLGTPLNWELVGAPKEGPA